MKEALTVIPQSKLELYHTNFQEVKEGPVRKKDVVGFNMQTGINAFVRNINQALVDGKFPKEAVKSGINELAEDLRSWTEEYALDLPFVGIRYGLKEINGKTRLVGKSGYPISDSILAEEKGGLVLDFARAHEQFQISAPEGSVAIAKSEMGDSGLVDHNGRKIIYPDSYFYLFKKINGQVLGMLIRTNLLPDEAEIVMDGLKRDLNPEKVHAMGFFLESSLDLDNPSVEVIDKILEIKPDAFGEKFNTHKKVYQALENYNKAFKHQALVDQYVDEIEQFALENINNLTSQAVQEIIQEKINQLLIKLTLKTRGIRSTGQFGELSEQDILKGLTIMHQSFHGCAGSGINLGQDSQFNFIKTLGGLRLGISQPDEEGWEKGFCKACGQYKKVGGCQFCSGCSIKSN